MFIVKTIGSIVEFFEKTIIRFAYNQYYEEEQPMKKYADEKTNVCLLFNCSACCNPVKLDSLRFIDPKRSDLPFIPMNGLLIPRSNMDSIKLKPYRCTNFNPVTGLCMDYLNRPEICRNTACLAFKITRKEEQRKIVNHIKREIFIKIHSFA